MDNEPFFNRAYWALRFSWWPRRCAFSGERIWLTMAYKGTAIWTGPGEPVYEYKWLTKTEFLIGVLKGKIC
jgi:hypothetical protein